eukprot:s1783_g2.t1
MTVPLRDVLEEALTSVSQHARSKLQDNELVATWSTGVDPLPNLLGHYGWLIAMMGLVLVLLIQWSRTLQRLEMTMARAVHAMQEAVQKLEENKSGGTSSYRPEQSDQGMEELWCDIRAYTKTVQHLMDMVAYQDRQLSDQAGQQEDVARGHVELTKAVNNLLAEVSVRMPRTATATSILDVVKVVKDMMTKMADSVPKDWHTDIAQAIDDLKAKLDTLPAQQTGDQTVSSGEGPSATHSKVRETLARVELLDKNLEKVHGKLAAVATVLEKIDPTRSLNEVGKPIWERLEQLTRSKLQSLAEEVNLVRGQHSSQHKDEVGLLKGLERTLAQLQSIMDGLSVRMAQIGASFSQAPVDSAGQTRALELLGQLGELCKETAVGLKDQEGRNPLQKLLIRSAWTELAVSPRSSKEAPESPIEKLVASFTFKAVCMVAIIANTMYLGVNADWKIRNAFGPIDGRQREVEDTAWDITFAVWFSIEILLRLLAEKISFFTGEEQAWNLFDSFLVVESIVGLLFPVGAKLSFLRIIRVFRLARVVKLVKAVKALRRLRTMIFSIANSFIDLMWAFLVVILILFIFGIILSNSAATYFESINLGSSDDIDEAVNVIKPLFGSLPVTMLSLWCAISGGNDWMVYAEALMVMDRDNSYVYVAVFLFYTAFCVVGLFNVVTGVFVDSAVCCRTEDEVLQSYMDDLKHTTAEIKKFFETADSDGSGTLSYREFCGHLRNPTVKAFFHGLDIDPEEASIIFRILDDDKNDEILIEEFINGTMKLKGHATKLEMITLMYDNTRQSMKLDSLCEFLEQEFQELRRVSRPCSGQGLPQGAWPASSLKTNQSGTT